MYFKVNTLELHQGEPGILNIQPVPCPWEGCVNKSLVGQEIFLQHLTRMCIEVPVIITFKLMHLVAKHKHKLVTLQMLYKHKIDSSE